MIYRVEFSNVMDSSCGFSYVESRREAEQALADWKRQYPEHSTAEIESAPTPKTKAEMIALLNRWGAHADNG